jgi:putative ABC transport system permease protein
VTTLENLWRDARYALQRLARDWPFTAAAVVILALGIGANTATFSLVNTGLFRRQPVVEPERLVNVYQNGRETGIPSGTSYPAYLDMAAQTDVFASAAAVSIVMPVRFQIDGHDGHMDSPMGATSLAPALAEYATANYLSVLGLEPSRGRWFLPGEDQPGADPVAVVSHHSWRNRFDADPSLLGRTFRINSVPVTIVGIGPPGLTSSFAAGLVNDFWLSLSSLALQEGSSVSPKILDRDPPEAPFDVRARLRAGVSVAQAQAAMDVLAARLKVDYPEEDPGRGIVVFPAKEVRTHPQIDAVLVPAATLVLTVVGLVLAIACSNLATLLLVRGSARAREMSVRLALGASRRQVVRQLLTESLLLAGAGGAAGCAIAFAAVRVLGRLDLPLVLDLTIDYRVLAFTIALTVVTGIAFGLAPAWQSVKIDLVSTLRAEDASTLGLGRRWFTLRNALVTAQVAISVLLLAGAGIARRSLEAARATDFGFDVERVAMIETDARYAGHTGDAVQRVYEELLRRIETIPGVESAALANGAPAGEGMRAVHPPLLFDGQPAPAGGDARKSEDGEEGVRVESLTAGARYFATLGVPLLRGRTFDDSDREDGPAVAVVNETMARRYFGTVDAVGRHFRYETEPDAPVTIVGVVSDVRTEVMEAPEPLLYRPFRQVEGSTPTVLVRTSLEASSVVGSMLAAVRALDPTLPVVMAKTMERHLDDALLSIKVAAVAQGVLGLAGLGLACVGLHAVVAFAVTRRSRELGIRVALGARGAQVVRLVAHEVAALVGAGVVLGLVLSWLATLALSAVALDLSASPHIEVATPRADALTFVFVALAIAVAGVAAIYPPARRASKVDPVVALRHQ